MLEDMIHEGDHENDHENDNSNIKVNEIVKPVSTENTCAMHIQDLVKMIKALGFCAMKFHFI